MFFWLSCRIGLLHEFVMLKQVPFLVFLFLIVLNVKFIKYVHYKKKKEKKRIWQQVQL